MSAMIGDKAERALNELLDLVNELKDRDLSQLRGVMDDLRCAETVENTADWHANMEQALIKLGQLGAKGKKLYARVARIKAIL